MVEDAPRRVSRQDLAGLRSRELSARRFSLEIGLTAREVTGVPATSTREVCPQPAPREHRVGPLVVESTGEIERVAPCPGRIAALAARRVIPPCWRKLRVRTGSPATVRAGSRSRS
jgi:hypothetical protein